MIDALEGLSNLAVLVFVVACMAAAGLGLSVRELLVPLRRVRLVLLALLANFLIAPALAYGLTQLFGLQLPFEIGLLLLGGAAGAPFLPKLTEAAKGDMAFSIGLMLLLMVGSVIFMPLALPLMIPGLAPQPWPILKPLLFTMLLPLAIGMVIHARSSTLAARLRPIFVRTSNISMIVTVLLLIGLNFPSIMGTFGTGAAAVGTLFVSLSFAAGYVLGGPGRDTRAVLGMGTGQRNVAAALLLATQNFTEPGVVVMLLVTTLAGLVVLLAAAWYLGKQPFTVGETENSDVGTTVK